MKLSNSSVSKLLSKVPRIILAPLYLEVENFVCSCGVIPCGKKEFLAELHLVFYAQERTSGGQSMSHGPMSYISMHTWRQGLETSFLVSTSF
ncbi:hypothetical protein ES319_A05G305400v1 [Gossypium barbadense]|uniref:Uncharacterized protein n=2 Tax=Gossypium TaxID=3633 RepID=A0A5J5VWD0_GOSBA|nr:hypothetical protein ES319_A05G305400v1 [Gossypium barbadense]TYH19019.1 hypothetical protein ES288_A05G319400v1 [Gossypium darwinii]